MIDFPKELSDLGYTEEGLEKDNPFNQFLYEGKEEKKPLVIYHANCADGFSAARCFHHYDNDRYEFFPGVYSKPPPDCTDRVVYLVDFSYKKDVVKEICKVAKIVVFLDHHKTAMDDLIDLDKKCSNFYNHSDINKSGAMIAWDYLFEHSGIEKPILLGHIQDRDLWKFKLPRTREISAAVFSYEYTFENWDILMGHDSVALMHLSHAGAAIERKHHKDIAELLVTCKYMMVIGDRVVPVASLPYIFSSDAAHIMARDYNNGNDFAACYWDTPTGRTFSLRSTEWGTDVSLVAAQYGGGGHKHAAGFSVSKDHRLANRVIDGIVGDLHDL